jgi:hypothetical protein
LLNFFYNDRILGQAGRKIGEVLAAFLEGLPLVHLTSSEKHLLYTDSRGQVTAASIDTLKAFAKTGECRYIDIC